ncbi:NAD kinase-like isoform X2 [Corticium candelabrum]|uniref:NAD kinase-like isoform X2 n=1 Tax=Corticium candelabrum TaxID=121492 RepID=UPI002E25B1AF|nr:NAD kinase-like isoform X2 [Corticium candelabrum]
MASENGSLDVVEDSRPRKLQPTHRFGPKGCLLEATKNHGRDEVDGFPIAMMDPRHLTWTQKPSNVLVIKKFRDSHVTRCFKKLIDWLHKVQKMTIYVEASILDEEELSDDSSFAESHNAMTPFTPGEAELQDIIDFIICLGGDGTLLYASSLFESSAPPLIGFHLGSLGFLTPFSFDNFESAVSRVIEGSTSVILRMRLHCRVLRQKSEKPPIKAIRSQSFNESVLPLATSPYQSLQPLKSDLLILNEVVIDRGPSPYLTNLEIYCNGHAVTTVQGDGIIIATPTGSTAYSAAAGSSMVHPNVPAVILTPICPHSLSFRPILVPSGAEIKVTVAADSRHYACVAFDGRNKQQLKQGDSVVITASEWPLPCISANDHIIDWFKSLSECLHWNVRLKQSPMRFN